MTNYSAGAASLFEVPFTGFIILQCLIWSIIFLRLRLKITRNNQSFFITYLPVLLIILFIFVTFFLSNLAWNIPLFSFIGLCRLWEVIFQVIGFTFALLCLAIAVNEQIRLVATGFLVTIAGIFFSQLNHLTQNLSPSSFVETLWILGLLLITLGFSNMLKNLSDLKMGKWLNSLNSVQAQSAFWSFLLCMLLLASFYAISYFLIGLNFLKIFPLHYLPSLLIGFSILAILASSIFARVLSTPFERIKTIIDSYMNEKEVDLVQTKDNSNIYEFELLETFLTKSFEVLKEKNKVQQEFHNLEVLQEKNKSQQELLNNATQVAHDIRSPLAALNTALKCLRGLSEEERILIRNATHRINDIANNLLVKYKIERKDIAETNEQKHLKAELVSSLLDHLISEKRVQMTEKSIDLILKFGNNTHSCFVNLELGKFKRVISNLINNASEAIESSGIIRVVLAKESDMLTIKIIDNGKGIPEDILLKIKQGKISSTKKEGCGLGISSSVQHIMSWGGSYDIESEVGKGTTFIIKLPIAEEPDWFQNNIILSQSTHIIVLDDDESIHNIWQTHFSACLENKLVTLDHFREPSAFREYCLATPKEHDTKAGLATPTCPSEAKSKGGPVSPQPREGGSHAKAGKTSYSENDLFLVDYEFVNSKETGLDLIEQLDLKKQAILVTSRYEEQEIRERVKNLGLKIIPKNFAPYIPISIEMGTVTGEQPDIVLIDDDKMITDLWKDYASYAKKKIAIFHCSEDFKKVMHCYNKDIPIYIDSDLKEKLPGEMFAKFLYEQEFHNLYLATEYEKDRYGDMLWIKDIVTKEPPF